jgi:hypothetical protein
VLGTRDDADPRRDGRAADNEHRSDEDLMAERNSSRILGPHAAPIDPLDFGEAEAYMM